jgi:uncharacterized membrane protein YcjF (UPF0283 family)
MAQTQEEVRQRLERRATGLRLARRNDQVRKKTVEELDDMKQRLRRRFWIELILAVANTALLALTIVWNEWIELVFQADPDAGSGALEWAIVGVVLVLTLAFAILARLEWRRALIQVA